MPGKKSNFRFSEGQVAGRAVKERCVHLKRVLFIAKLKQNEQLNCVSQIVWVSLLQCIKDTILYPQTGEKQSNQ